MPTFSEYRGWEYAPIRFVVWVLAAIYLGRVHYNNTLWDLRQLSAFEITVKTLAIAVVCSFVYWNVALADPGIITMIWGVVLVFVAKVLLVVGVVRAGTAFAARQQYDERRRFEAATGRDDGD